VTVTQREKIEGVARDLLGRLWRKRGEIWPVPPDPDGLLPIPVEVLIREVLDLRLEEPEEIPANHRTPHFETAGFVNCAEGRIVVAQKQRPEWRRFTMAHEVGHFMLHPKANYHRDRTLTGGERANSGRPEIEQEADVFAAELLMPRRMLIRKFTEALGPQFDGRIPNLNDAFWLSAGTDRAVTEIRLAEDLRYRAMVVAETRSFGGRHFTPLVRTFGVSPTAMAIQLEDLRLVI
jgi:hypothetical protein